MDFLTIYFSHFLGFRELLTNFSPFTFSPLRFGGGNFSCWCGIQAGGGRRVPLPRPPVSRYGWKITPHFYNTFSDFPGERKVQTWGRNSSKPPQFTPAGKSPQTAHGKNEKAKNSPAASNPRK